MRKAFGLIGASLLLAGPALAADLAVKAPVYKAPPLVAPAWAGWYIGGNAGWVGSANNGIGNTGTDTGFGGLGNELNVGALPTATNLGIGGFLGGAQIGYNWQAGNWVYGVEADIAGSSAKGSANVNGLIVPPTVAVPTALSVNRELDWLSTYRARLGFTAMPAFLVYGTGGVAVGQTKVGNAWTCVTCAPASTTEASTTNEVSHTAVGWTAGAGVEWMFAPGWSAKAEYLYVDLGTNSSTIAYAYGPDTSTLTSSVRDTYNVVRGGINYHF
jgi:outer membrane immunogenic protein